MRHRFTWPQTIAITAALFAVCWLAAWLTVRYGGPPQAHCPPASHTCG